MVELQISNEWISNSSDDPEFNATATQLKILVDGVNLTRNQDIWAQTIRENVNVSAYPLAMWFASSWWRLSYEPLPAQQPGHQWRMSHELGAANHGFVWPRIVFAPDGEAVYLWAGSSMQPNQSVQYLNGLEFPKQIELLSFQRSIDVFIQSVINRLGAKDIGATDLAELWNIIKEDRSNPDVFARRKIEAELGFDPEECPDYLISEILSWKDRIGNNSLSELAPTLSIESDAPDVDYLKRFVESPGIAGQPSFCLEEINHETDGAPWERAVHDARALRRAIGNRSDKISNKTLLDLLGVSQSSTDNWHSFSSRPNASVAIPNKQESNKFKFIPRKNNIAGKRFEQSRFIGDYIWAANSGDYWLTMTDLSTARQKYQRAFAAEFLCPIDSLISFLDNDFSSNAIEEAAENFEVGEMAVRNLLGNNGFLYERTGGFPYKMVA